MSVQNMDATNTIVPIIESVFSDWESHDADFAPEFLGLLKPPESNSLVSDSQKYYRKNFIACAIFFCTTVLCSFQSTEYKVQSSVVA